MVYSTHVTYGIYFIVRIIHDASYSNYYYYQSVIITSKFAAKNLEGAYK